MEWIDLFLNQTFKTDHFYLYKTKQFNSFNNWFLVVNFVLNIFISIVQIISGPNKVLLILSIIEIAIDICILLMSKIKVIKQINLKSWLFLTILLKRIFCSLIHVLWQNQNHYCFYELKIIYIFFIVFSTPNFTLI